MNLRYNNKLGFMSESASKLCRDDGIPLLSDFSSPMPMGLQEGVYQLPRFSVDLTVVEQEFTA